jgi:hypothetical protein
MSEELQWKKKTGKSEFIENLERLMHDVVLIEIKEINSKIESLCSMGVIKDDKQIQELREKMKLVDKKMSRGVKT